MGLQQIASYCAIACYYVIGLPLAWLLAFKTEVGVIGLQGGVTGAVIIQSICYSLILLWTNW